MRTSEKNFVHNYKFFGMEWKWEWKCQVGARKCGLFCFFPYINGKMSALCYINLLYIRA